MSMRFQEADLHSEDRQRLHAIVLQSQLIHVALIAGSLIMTVVLTGLSFSQEPGANPSDNQEDKAAAAEVEFSKTLAMGAAGVTTLGLLGSIAIPMIVRSSSVNKLDQSSHSQHRARKAIGEEETRDTSLPLGPLLQTYQTSHILGLAILESSVLLAGITLLFGAPLWVLAFPVFLILVMALRIPRRSAVETWIAQQMRD